MCIWVPDFVNQPPDFVNEPPDFVNEPVIRNIPYRMKIYGIKFGDLAQIAQIHQIKY